MVRSHPQPDELSNVAVEILLTLMQGPRHGYAIAKFIEGVNRLEIEELLPQTETAGITGPR